MKKALKLGGIFLLIVGLIVLLLNLDSLIPKRKGGGGGQPLTEDVMAECAKIREDWANAKGWDDALYRSQIEDIDQNQRLNYYSPDGFKAVKDALREASINAVCEAYWESISNYNGNDKKASHTAVCSRYNGVVSLSSFEDYASDDRIKKVKSVHTVYMNIYNFVSNEKHIQTPDFNPGAPTSKWWTTFDDKKKSVLVTAESYRKNNLYQDYLQSVPGFAVGLDHYKLESLLNEQRSSYYQELFRKIKKYYDSTSPTRELVNQLNAVAGQYAAEYSANKNELVNYVLEYEGRLPDGAAF